MPINKITIAFILGCFTNSVLASEASSLDTRSLDTRTAEEIFTRPKVEASTMFPVNGWGITDMTMGSLIGAYMVLQGKAYGYDCQSRFVSEGLLLIPVSKYFDKPFTAGFSDWLFWVGFVIDVAIHIYSITKLVIQCGKEYKYTVDSGWW